MDIQSLSQYASNAFLYTIPFLFVLTVVVFFHELGHFLVARYNKVDIESFSVGFGRELFGFVDSKNTRWKFCWIPLGGYVKFLDDEDPTSSINNNLDKDENINGFHNKSLIARASIVAAGPIANFILAIILFSFLYTFIGKPMVQPIVENIKEQSAAEVAGFNVGDKIVRINDKDINNFSDIPQIVKVNPGIELTFTVHRNDQEIVILATPGVMESSDKSGNVTGVGVLGISGGLTQDNVIIKKYPINKSFIMGVSDTYNIIKVTLNYIGGIIVGKESADQLGGPIRIAQISGQVASMGFSPLISLTALLSVSIGLINLFPVPMLDGGHLFFYAIEAIRKKPLSEKVQGICFRIGLGFVIFLMIYATWNDLIQLNIF